MKYMAFPRGINVGGHAIVKMADLADSLAKQIERQLEKTMGRKIRLFVRTIRHVRAIAEKNPFTAKAGEAVHVTFLHQAPDKKSQRALLSLKSEVDDFAVKGKEIYKLRRDRDKSIFSNDLIEKTPKLLATTRNMTMIRKIADKYK